MEAVVIVVNLVVLGAVAWRLWQVDPALRWIYWPAWAARLASGLLLGMLYTYYYHVGDTFAFFDDGATLARLARKDALSYLQFLWSGDQSLLQGAQLVALQSRSLFLSKAISLINLVTYDNYWLTCLYFSSVSFAASCYLVTMIVRYYPQLKIAAIIAFLLFPSVVFWSSGIIKESLALAALYFLTALFLKVWHRDRPRIGAGLLAIAAIWVLISLRYYFAAVFLPVVFATAVTRFIIIPRIKSAGPGVEFAIWSVMLFFPLAAASIIYPNFYPQNFLAVIVQNYHVFHQVSDPGDAITFHGLTSNIPSVLLHAPWAWFSGLFRPFPWEAGNVLQALMAAENLILFAAALLALPALRFITRSPHRLLLVALIAYTGILCVFITLSTPNFGTLCRYRVGYVPFFVFLVLIPRGGPRSTDHRPQ